jgi:hypothetical protein
VINSFRSRSARSAGRAGAHGPGPAEPASAAAGYGVPADPRGEAGAYLSARGLRDGTFGLACLAVLVFAGARAEAWFMVSVALVPLLETLMVLRHGGPKAVAFGIHFATAVVVLISAGLLFAV